MNDVSKQDLIYAAGFFDGEGCIGIWEGGSYKGRKTPSLVMVINVTGTNELSIAWWKSTFGVGRIYKIPRKHRKDNWSDSWKWLCDARQARSVLEQILPYLKLKRREAELALEFQRHKDEYVSFRNAQGQNTPLPDNVIQYRANLAATIKAEKRRNRSY
jgi:hypothetical protein